MLDYPCKIGQEARCKKSGCEFKKHFNFYCGLTPTKAYNELIEKKKKQEIKKQEPKINFELVRESANPLSTSRQAGFIKKIRVVL